MLGRLGWLKKELWRQQIGHERKPKMIRVPRKKKKKKSLSLGNGMKKGLMVLKKNSMLELGMRSRFRAIFMFLALCPPP